MNWRRIIGTSLSVLLIFSFAFLQTGLVNLVLASDELIVSFVSIGEDGVLSPTSPVIEIVVTNSIGTFVSGVEIRVEKNDRIGTEVWKWSVSEKTGVYEVRLTQFSAFSIKDDFSFVFERTGYNTLTITREISINNNYMEIWDEYGLTKDTSLHYNIDAFPSHFFICNQLITTFVDSTKYYLATGLDNSDDDNRYAELVLDTNFNIVLNQETCQRAWTAYQQGSFFSHYSPEAVAELSQNAIDIKNYAILGKTFLWVRDTAAELAGSLTRLYLSGDVSSFTSYSSPYQPTIISKITANTNNIVEYWLDQMTEHSVSNYFSEGVEVTENLFFLTALEKLDIAADMFLTLSAEIEAYAGTEHYEASEVEYLFESWTNASHELMGACDILNEIFPPSDVTSQILDVAVQFAEGFTNVPIGATLTILELYKVNNILSNSLYKYVAMDEEFYGWIRDKTATTMAMHQKISNTGQSPFVIPIVIDKVFSVNAHYNGYSSATIAAGQSIVFTIDVELESGDVPSVSLSCIGQDGTMGISFAPSSSVPPFTSSMTITTSGSTTGSFVLTITGSDGTNFDTAIINLHVLNINPGNALTMDPLGPVVTYGSYVRFHGTADPYYNGREVGIIWSLNNFVNGYWVEGAMWLPLENGEWQYPSGTANTWLYLHGILDIELPCTYYMKARIQGTVVESNTLVFQVIKAPTWTEFYTGEKVVTEGNQISFSGSVNSDFGIGSGDWSYCQGPWYIDYRKDAGSWTEILSGDTWGQYKVTGGANWWGIDYDIGSQTWVPSSPGEYEFRLRYSGDKNYLSSESNVVHVTVLPGSYSISVSIEDLPPEFATDVYINGGWVGVQSGGSTETYDGLSVNGENVVSVEPIVQDPEEGYRYVATPQEIPALTVGTYVFSYDLEYKLTTQIEPESSGSIGLSEASWVSFGSSVEVSAHPEEGYELDYWVLNSENMGDDNPFTFVMDAPIVLQGVFKESDKELTLENYQVWYWGDDTEIKAVAIGDVDGDTEMEIVTGGDYGISLVSQLCVWDGASLELENVQTWKWSGDTCISSVVLADVDGDDDIEIITGGFYSDGALLCVWDGSSLQLENYRAWQWGTQTKVNSVAVEDVDGDTTLEIVTGGQFYDGTRIVAQLCVWNGANLALDNVKIWYWTGNTKIDSVCIADVDDDSQQEIITGGTFVASDSILGPYYAQVCVWTGSTLANENVRIWYWGNTYLEEVCGVDIDDDETMEIITGGFYSEAQLTSWDGCDMSLEHVMNWKWSGNYHRVRTVDIADVNGDGSLDIVTGVDYHDGTQLYAQLIIFDDFDFEVIDLVTWYWTGYTYLTSVCVGDVDGDGNPEIVSGGYFDDTTRYNAQLLVWELK